MTDRVQLLVAGRMSLEKAVRRFSPGVIACLLALCSGTAAQAASLLMAENGKAALKVVISPYASEATKKHAADLADMLARISSAAFDVVSGDGQGGIAVGTAADFPSAPVKGRLDPADAMRGDEYILQTHGKGAWLVGATETAVGHAVWDFLYRLGYRQYFPGQTWEIIPERKKLEASLEVFSFPSYVTRSIWHQWGSFNVSDFATWRVRNRIASHFDLQNGHMTHTVEWTNKQAFADHPEYYALVKGQRTPGSKLCISNPGLRKLFAEELIRRFEENPQAASMSIEPSDGAGWCECEACKDLGSVSDRQVMLANETAQAVEAKLGTNKYLGMLAYFQHSAAPSIKVSPQVIVTAATRFGVSPVEETLDGWRKQGARLGVYDYYSVNDWHRDLPGFPGASRLEYLTQSLPAWHRIGARFFSAESGENWGPCGLGYFLASRILWDVSEASRARELRSEFLELCFKRAARPMDEFYTLIDGTHRGIQLDDIVGQMYRRLDAARKLETDPAVTARIDELVGYTRYVELYKTYETLKRAKAPRQKEFEALLHHVFRIRATGMVHGVALVRSLPGYDEEMVVPAAATISGSKAAELWQNSAPPLTADEIAKMLADGIAANPVLPFQAVAFSTDLVPAAKRLGLASVPIKDYNLHGNGVSWLAWIEPGRGGLNVRGAGEFQYKLYAVDKEMGDVLVSEVSVKTPPYDGRKHSPTDVKLTSPRSGLHRVVVSGNDSWEVRQLPEEAGSHHVLPSATAFNNSPDLYFYVPKGTTAVACETFLQSRAVMKDGAGAVVFEFKSLAEADKRKNGPTAYFHVPVKAGQDGAVWKIENLKDGTYCLLHTVPPYYARSAEELLLPKEVVERDAKN